MDFSKKTEISKNIDFQFKSLKLWSIYVFQYSECDFAPG